MTIRDVLLYAIFLCLIFPTACFSLDPVDLKNLETLSNQFKQSPKQPVAQNMMEILNLSRHDDENRPSSEARGKTREDIMKSCILLGLTYGEGEYASLKGRRRVVSDFENQFMRYWNKQPSNDATWNHLLGCYTTMVAALYCKQSPSLTLEALANTLYEDFQILRVGRPPNLTRFIIDHNDHLKEALVKFLTKDGAFQAVFNKVVGSVCTAEWQPREREKDIRIVVARDPTYDACVQVAPNGSGGPGALPWLSGVIVRDEKTKQRFLLTSGHAEELLRQPHIFSQIKVKGDWESKKIPTFSIAYRFMKPFLKILELKDTEISLIEKHLKYKVFIRYLYMDLDWDIAIGRLDADQAPGIEGYTLPSAALDETTERLTEDLAGNLGYGVGHGWSEDIVHNQVGLLQDGEKRVMNGEIREGVRRSIIAGKEQKWPCIFLPQTIKEFIDNICALYPTPYASIMGPAHSGAPLFDCSGSLRGLLEGGTLLGQVNVVRFIVFNGCITKVLTDLMTLIVQKGDVNKITEEDMIKIIKGTLCSDKTKNTEWAENIRKYFSLT